MIFFSFLYFLGYLTSIVVSLSCKDDIPPQDISTSDYHKYGLTYKYKDKRIISSGGFATVYSVRKYDDYHKFAYKYMSTDKGKNGFIREVKALCEFQGSKNILQITDWGLKEFVIVTELALTNAVYFFKDKHHNYEMLDDFVYLREKPDIKDYMSVLGNESKKLIELKSRFVEAVINALTDMHAKNFIHRDLKWSNVLVFDKEAKIIKLADLGFCEKDVNITSRRGTKITLAPEVLNRSLTSPICGKATDIYSLGVMIMQMFPCIQHKTNLIYRLINLNPSDRPNIRTAENIFQEVKRIMLQDISFINEQDKQKEQREENVN